MKTITAIIIDDEELAREIIKEYLTDSPEIKVVAECRDAHEAIAAISEYNPDLLFLDIQMPEINGFELLEMLDELPKIIFSTAYDQYAIKAFEVNAVDYLLKPYDAERFEVAVNRAKQNILSETETNETITKLLESINKPKDYLDRILIKQSGRIVIISTNEIYLIKAMDDYAEIHIKKESYLIQQSLNHLESRLDPDKFLRVHRSYITNINAIKDIVSWAGGRYKLFLKNGTEISVSRSGYQKLKRFFI